MSDGGILSLIRDWLRAPTISAPGQGDGGGGGANLYLNRLDWEVNERRELKPSPERYSWIGRACWIFLRKSFVPRSLRAPHRPAPRSLLGLRKHLLRNHFPPN